MCGSGRVLLFTVHPKPVPVLLFYIQIAVNAINYCKATSHCDIHKAYFFVNCTIVTCIH